MLDIVEAKHVGGYAIWIRFEDGSEGEIDLSAELEGPVFLPLKDVSYFSQLRVNPDTGTVEWPNGADFAPEFLYEKTHITV
jgi:Protein of unknown function (DUF2442).